MMFVNSMPVTTFSPVYGYPAAGTYSLSSSSSSDDSLNVTGLPLYPSPNIAYVEPQPLSRKYGLFADYVTPLEPVTPVIQPQFQTSIDPYYIPGARILSDTIEIAQPQHTYSDVFEVATPQQQVLSDVIEFVGDRSSYANIPYFYNSAAPTKRLTRIIRYVTREIESDDDSDNESLQSASQLRASRKTSESRAEEQEEKEEKKEHRHKKEHRKKKSKHHRKSSNKSNSE